MTVWVGRYAIVGGEVQEHGPWLVERMRQREDESVHLVILAEPFDDRSADYCAEVAAAVAELFSRESLSITGGLLRALRQAHTNLAEWNRRSLREHQVAVGLTCVAIRDREATIGQVGPGVVYATGSDGLLRYATENSPAAQPLGSDEPIQPHFFSVDVADHSLLLVTSSVERMVGVSVVGQTLTAGPERALANLFLRTRDMRDMTAVLIADVAISEEAMPAPVEARHSEAAERAERVERSEPVAPADPWTRAPAPAPVDSGAEPVVVPRRTHLPAVRRDRGPYAGSSAADRLRTHRPGAREALLAWRPPPKLALLALSVVAVVALAWCTVPSLLEEDRGARLDDAIRGAEAHIAAAAEAPDTAGSRRELQDALADIARARSVGAADPRIDSLQARVDQQLVALDAVIDLGEGALRRVIGFEGTITAPFAAGTIVFGDGVLWLVDNQRGRVFRIDPNSPTPQPQEVYRSGSTYGGVEAREPRAVTWDATRSQLLLLDSASTLFGVGAGSLPAAVPIRGLRELRSAVALAAYNGNLYVLDPQGGEVWRYLPGGNGFDSERSGLLGGIELADARHLVVDGDVFVLGGQSVRHFQSSREVAPLLQGADRALNGPVGLAVQSGQRLVYVAERGGRRIVMSDRDGAYRGQYRHPQFFDLRGIALSADGSTVYALSGEGIFAFAAGYVPSIGVTPSTPAATPSATPARAPAATSTPAPTAAPPPVPQAYVVISGDTATGIAQRFGVTVEQLAAANNRTVASLSSLQIGDRLTIPAR